MTMRFSPQGVACKDCHDPDQEFTEAEIISEGANGSPARHTPSIWNSVYPEFLSGTVHGLALVPSHGSY